MYPLGCKEEFNQLVFFTLISLLKKKKKRCLSVGCGHVKNICYQSLISSMWLAEGVSACLSSRTLFYFIYIKKKIIFLTQPCD